MITTTFRTAGKALFYLLLAHAPLLAQTDVQAWYDAANRLKVPLIVG